MSIIGSLKIPDSAFIFLSLVVIFLLILLLALMALNKLLCFANCRMPSMYYIPNPDNVESDSESDDSDDDIYTNYTQIEKTAEADKLRSSTRSIRLKPAEGDKLRLSIRSEKEKTDSHESTISEEATEDISEKLPNIAHVDPDKDSKSQEKIAEFPLKHSKTAIARINLFLDTLGSKLKIQMIQVFDLKKVEENKERKKSVFMGRASLASSYQLHCTILPAKKYKFKTKTKQGPDPFFNETFYVPKITTEIAESLAIRFRIYATQNSTLNVVGQCTFDLNTADLSIETEYNLTMNEPDDDENLSLEKLSLSSPEMLGAPSDNIQSQEYIPELMLGLLLNSTTGRLTVEIIRGIQLSKDKYKDFYVKLSLFLNTGQELSFTKTSVRKNTTSPVFRESFMFQIALFQMKEVTLMVSVFAKKSIHRKQLIGWIALGHKSSGEEEENHWNEVQQGLQTEVIRSHKLHQNSNSKKFLQ